MINRTSVYGRTATYRTQIQNQKENQETQKQEAKKQETQQEKKQQPKIIDKNANEILALQNQIFVKPKTTESKNKPQPRTQTQETKQESQTKQNFFLVTTRTSEINDLVPKDSVTKEIPKPATTNGGATATTAAETGKIASSVSVENLTEEALALIAEAKKEALNMGTSGSELVKGLHDFANAIKNPEAYGNAVDAYAQKWMLANGVEEITTQNVGEVLGSFLKDEFGLSVANLGKLVGGAAIFSVASQIAINTAVDVVPDLAKGLIGWNKDFWGSIFKGDIKGAAKTLFIDGPIFLLKGSMETITSLAKNTYEKAKDIVTPGAEAVYNVTKDGVKSTIKNIKIIGENVVNSAKNIGEGIADTGKKVFSGIKDAATKIKNGNVIGAMGSTVGGIVDGAVSTVKTVVKGVRTSVKAVGEVVGNTAKTVVRGAGKVIGAVFKTAGEIFGNPKEIISAVGKVGSAVGKGVASAAKAVGRGAAAVGRGVADAAKAVGKGIANAAKAVGKGVKNFFKGW